MTSQTKLQDVVSDDSWEARCPVRSDGAIIRLGTSAVIDDVHGEPSRLQVSVHGEDLFFTTPIRTDVFR